MTCPACERRRRALDVVERAYPDSVLSTSVGAHQVKLPCGCPVDWNVQTKTGPGDDVAWRRSIRLTILEHRCPRPAAPRSPTR